jgi:copper chaperone
MKAKAMEQIFAVENIKCGGCENTIRKALLKIPMVEDVSVNIQTGTIIITGGAERKPILEKLYELGYPEVGDNSFISKAKSYVSCAIGKVS